MKLRAGLPAAVIAIAVYVAFLNKPFNIDDNVFLMMADHMTVDPLHPASVQLVVNGRPPAWVSAGMWSGPVMPALLVPSILAGGAEWLAHLMVLGVFLVGIFATAALALRLGLSDRGARWAALLTTCSAAVIAMSMTSMPDLPTMSLGVLGAERLVAYRDERRLAQALGATIALALAVLSRQHIVLLYACLVPLMFTAWPGTLREFGTTVVSRRFLALMAICVAAAGLVALAYLVMRDDHAAGSLASTPLRIADTSLWRVNLPNVPAQWVLTFPLGLAWAWLHGRDMLRSAWCWLGAGAGAYLAYTSHVFYRHLDWLPWQAPLTALGMAVLVHVFVDAVRRRDHVELGLAAWLLIMTPIAVYSHLPPKYFVPSAPAMAILILRHVESQGRNPTRVLGTLAVLHVVLGVLIIRADAAHGETGREGGAVVASYVARGERVWFDGTWGFQWYAMQAGAMPVTTEEPKPQPGDIVVVGMEGWVIKAWPNKQLLEKRTFPAPGGRIMRKPAGFFSNVAWGPLPWWWSRKPLGPIEVYRIL